MPYDFTSRGQQVHKLEKCELEIKTDEDCWEVFSWKLSVDGAFVAMESYPRIFKML